jgi:hydroxyacylglutathione hydrolase
MFKYKIIPVTPFEQNCTLFWCDETMEGAVIDPGGDVDKILAAIKQAKFTVSKVLLPHAHLDHAGATDAISKHFSVQIEGPQKEDQFWIDLIPVQKQQMGFTEGESFTPDRWLEQGDTVEFGNISA